MYEILDTILELILVGGALGVVVAIWAMAFRIIND